MEAKIVVKNDPIGDFLLARDESNIWYQVTEEDLDRLGVTEAEKEEARRGYRVACTTIALDTLSDLLEEG